MITLASTLAKARVLPVLTVPSLASGNALVEALVAGGCEAVEITLRTEAALAVIDATRRAFPDLTVAAGTVVSGDQLDAVVGAGAHFAVSPGLSEMLVRRAESKGVPMLPGVATASEVMAGLELGLHCFKLFPAVQAGGLALLRALAEPLATARFCPTGGLDAANFTEYLSLGNVVCVGGSWMAPRTLVQAGAWEEITKLVRMTMERARAGDSLLNSAKPNQVNCPRVSTPRRRRSSRPRPS